MLRARAGDAHPGLRTRDQDWTWAQVVEESARRAALAARLLRPGPPHIGVLLSNVPEFVFWLGGAALGGATLVGINPTRDDDTLAGEVRHTDCRMIVTDAAGAARLRRLDLGVDDDQILEIDSARYRELLASCSAALPEPVPLADALMLLLFTSGTTGASKAVRCTQGRLSRIAYTAVGKFGHERADVDYCCMPLFHGNALMALWAPALAVGATVCLTPKFSASQFVSDIRYFGATYFTYVGKAVAYILATPPDPADADNRLTRGFGTEASPEDRARFQRRFGAVLAEGYGSSEGGAVVRPDPAAPPGALGRPAHDGVAVIDAETLQRCPAAVLDAHGHVTNAEEAVGEIVDTTGSPSFEGYYHNDDADAQRLRNGWYWSGDLGYLDTDGFLYFAGRHGDWVRVDGENTSTLVTERVLRRFPGVLAAAAYGVPDPRSGDRLMAAVEVADPDRFDVAALAGYLSTQDDLGSKGIPRLLRVSARLPATASNKIVKRALQQQRWDTAELVYEWAGRAPVRYVPLTAAGKRTLASEFASHGRAHLLTLGQPMPALPSCGDSAPAGPAVSA
ncbi:acyl-CoA synthetase [Nocardia stercoris]|uniref:Acyl-CoA synthetase n=1 Tax=Nocardia stercoris TaxID=2483361 RepID=A0A3M2LA72_9NOCA|nr:AMP-binding protein [Nocardia stercoris]RMI31478.1 acyl-CoA synthetase [Nocardia stercoris]